jgi:hypothetical protein
LVISPDAEHPTRTVTVVDGVSGDKLEFTVVTQKVTSGELEAVPLAFPDASFTVPLKLFWNSVALDDSLWSRVQVQPDIGIEMNRASHVVIVGPAVKSVIRLVVDGVVISQTFLRVQEVLLTITDPNTADPAVG